MGSQMSSQRGGRGAKALKNLVFYGHFAVTGSKHVETTLCLIAILIDLGINLGSTNAYFQLLSVKLVGGFVKYVLLILAVFSRCLVDSSL